MRTITSVATVIGILIFLSVNIEPQKTNGQASNTGNRQPISLGTNNISLTPGKAAMMLAATACLRRSPNLKPLPQNALKEDEFIALAQTLVGNQFAADRELTSLVDAIEALESVTADVGRPKATIKSTPAGWTVEYRGYVDYKKNRGAWQNVKTNSTPEVDPKQHIFRCIKENGDSCGERIRPCDTSANCIAEFP